MKEKIATAAISALMLISLISVFQAGTVSAQEDPVPAVELQAKGDSSIGWTTGENKFGDYSVKLSMRGGWWDEPNNNAEVQISITDNLKISEIDNWSYWVIAPDSYTVPIELNIDTTGDGEIDKVLWATKAGDTPEGWFEVNQDTGHWWYGVGSPDSWAELQSWVNERYPDAGLVRVDLGYGPLGSNQAIDAYVDDFTINGVIYELEPSTTVGLTAETSTITAISVSPTSIDFGTVKPGDTKSGPDLTVENIGTVEVVVDATLNPQTGTVFNYLKLKGGYSPGYSGFWDNIVSGLLPSQTSSLTTQLVVPSTYSAQGTQAATLVFEATAA